MARHETDKTSLMRNVDGNAVMIFGLSLMPIMLTLGAATDFTRFTIARSALQQATDAAVLTVASKMVSTTTLSQAQAQAQVLIRSRPRMSDALVTLATITPDRMTLCLTSQTAVPNMFMKLANIGALTPRVTSCADLASKSNVQTTFEIALVLDNSGSMSSSAGGVSKMQALKTAANSFIDTLYAKSNNVQMSITPFAAGVVALNPADSTNRTLSWIDTLGASSQHWIVFGGKTAANAQGFTSRFDIFNRLKTLRSSWDWGGCLEGPVYPKNVTDAAPSAGDPDSLFVPFLAPDEPSGNSNYGNSYISDGGSSSSGCTAPGNDWGRLTNVCKYKVATSASSSSNTPNDFCPNASTQTLLQLTSGQTTLKNKINQLVEGGNTNLHEGFMWGWRTISPNAPFAAGRAYGTQNNRKIIIFMTDGANFWQAKTNTVAGSAYQAAGYYSYNGAANLRFPNGSTGNGVDYQNVLKAAANTGTSYSTSSRDMQDELTRQACTNAKAAGVEIFTIGFSTPTDPIDAQGLALMKACATNDDHYFKAEDSAQLNMAFSTISASLGKLRLSQ